MSLGIIGPKVGLQGVDNGYLVLDDVRIPRDQMLMRYAQVSAKSQPTPGADLGGFPVVLFRLIDLSEISLYLLQILKISPNFKETNVF